METRSGSVSISTENIFPIIKKWLYSEKDIFIREVVSNSSDAVNKIKKLVSIGEAEIEEETLKGRIEVSLDKDAGTIKISDNGIGMTEDEVVKYINQIAFSGAKEFIEKYSGKTEDAQIIGHFGLGFYSTFMVSDRVEIDTLSWQTGSEAVHWESTDGMDFSISPSEQTTRGTTITLHISEDSKEFLDEFKIKEVLTKYFSFLPIELYFTNENVVEDEEDDKEESVKEESANEESANEESANEENSEEIKDLKEVKVPEPINNTTPLWAKNPKDCTDEEYKAFYRDVFMDYTDPLFWIHLNMDYPFNLKGILYFPKLRNELDNMEGKIKLYYNQVFVADNIKEVIPEFLMLLKGTIDCPDLPLNVSRSFLQNDGYVSKISAHITKKVADKLNGLFATEREAYNSYWDNINPFVKYGCLKDDKFYDRVKESLIYKTTNNEYVTLQEYLEKNKDKHENKVFYVDNEVLQAQYIKLFKDNGMEAVILPAPIDSHFVQFIEYKDTTKVKFVRIDSDISESLKSSDCDVSREEMDKLATDLESIFKTVSNNDKLKIKVEPLKSTIPAMLVLSEESRRLQEMSKMYGGGFNFPMGDEQTTLVLNQSNSIIKSLYTLKDNLEKKDDVQMICSHIYDLAIMAHKPMDADAMTRFIERSSDILARVIG